MRIPIATIIKIFVDESYDTYISIESARDDDSDGGRKVTRKEVWTIATNLIFRIGPKVEMAILKRNTDHILINYRWKGLSILASSLTELPTEFERAKRGDNKIDRKEAIEIIFNVLKKSIPTIVDSLNDDIE